MMKKIVLCLYLAIVVLCCSTISMAAETFSFGIGVSSNKTQLNPGDEVTLKVSLKDMKNVSEGILVLEATIDYDTEIFETITSENIKGLGVWSTGYNNGKVLADNDESVKTNGDVFSITLKVKSTAKIGESTKITIKDCLVSESDIDVEANAPATLTLNIVEKTQEDTETPGTDDDQDTETPGTDNDQDTETPGTDDNQDTETPGTDDNQDTETPSTDDKEDTTKPGTIPNAGSSMIIIISIAIVSLIGIFLYKKCNKYKEI